MESWLIAVWSEVKRADLISSGRNDAEYFKPEYIEFQNVLNKIDNNIESFKNDLDFVKCGPFGSTIKKDTYMINGVVVARPFNINNMKFEYDNLVFISHNDMKQKKLSLYEDGDIYYTRVGDIRIGLLKKNIKYPEITISPNIIAVRVKKDIIRPEYIVAFFNTEYGLKQIERGLKI
ncbi:MAG: hypothetical protein GY846_04360, partial [Deltaproteobacteria bacterium]|nr:hypothetical protein [Deltaproteobacteria bacterium]